MIRQATSVLRNWIGKRTPVLLQIKPTYRCNMRCAFCTVWKTRKKELSTEEFRRIIHDARKLGAGIVNFSGGEPLLRKDIAQLVSYAKQEGFVTMMNTNGFMLHDRAAELVENLDNCIVSLDFPTAREHDGFRGQKGAYRNAIKGIKAAREHGLKASINCVVMSRNMAKLEDMAKLAKRLQVGITFVLYNDKLMDEEPARLQVGIKEYAAKVKMLKRVYGSVGPEDFFLDTIVKQDFTCRATDTVINVQPDGRFDLPCEVNPIAHGNALELAKEYRSKKVRNASRMNGRYRFCKGCTSQCSLLPSLLLNPINALEAYRKRN